MQYPWRSTIARLTVVLVVALGSGCPGRSGYDRRGDAATDAGCPEGCDLPFAVASCADGACVVSSCEPGYADCDGLAVDGCEASLAAPSN